MNLVSSPYLELYRQIARRDDVIWGDRDRENYEADVWYNKNRNSICLAMLRGRGSGKRILGLGSRGWVDKELFESLGCAESARIDIVPDDGVQYGDACNTGFQDSSFDIVICRELIEHIPFPVGLMQEIHRLLVHNGLLLITTPNVYNVPPDGIEHVRGYSPSEFLDFIESHKFTIEYRMGNVPNIFSVLIRKSAKNNRVLQDFQDADRFMREIEQPQISYWWGTQLFVLARRA